MSCGSPRGKQEHIAILEHATTPSLNQRPLEQQLYARFEEVATPSPAPPTQVSTPAPPSQPNMQTKLSKKYAELFNTQRRMETSLDQVIQYVWDLAQDLTSQD